jgi:hypothetical protein
MGPDGKVAREEEGTWYHGHTAWSDKHGVVVVSTTPTVPVPFVIQLQCPNSPPLTTKLHLFYHQYPMARLKNMLKNTI